jgi:hypothetical protein
MMWLAVSRPVRAPAQSQAAAPAGSAAPLWRRVGKRFGQHVVLEQLVVRGDDVLDLRTVLGFLQPQRVDQDALIGNGRRNALEFGQARLLLASFFRMAGVSKRPASSCSSGERVVIAKRPWLRHV